MSVQAFYGVDDDEFERRVQAAEPLLAAALAEAGYPRSIIRSDRRGITHGFDEEPVPLKVMWRAGQLIAPVVGLRHPCWDCYDAHDGMAGPAIRACVDAGHPAVSAVEPLELVVAVVERPDGDEAVAAWCGGLDVPVDELDDVRADVVRVVAW